MHTANAHSLEQFQKILRQELPVLKERFGVAALGLFGSFVRREQREDSDLDILVRFNETPGLLRFVQLEDHLSDLLDIKVDLVMEDALKPQIGRRILKEAVPI